MNNKYLDADYQRAVSEFVQREVSYCASGIVHTLANGYGDIRGITELSELCEKAFELSCPVDDWSEPIFDHVRNLDRKSVTAYLEHWSIQVYDHELIDDLRTAMMGCIRDEGEREYCEENNLDPYQIQIYEHWIVSKWLAEMLEQRGEKIDSDFNGLVVWGRPTTGQSISMDRVICNIYDKLQKAKF